MSLSCVTPKKKNENEKESVFFFSRTLYIGLLIKLWLVITVSKSKIIDKESESYKEAKSREMIQGTNENGELWFEGK